MAMLSGFTSKLYVRIWLAVVATVVVLTFLVGAAWRFTKEPPQLPIREVLVHNKAGEVIGTAQTKIGRRPADGLEFEVLTTDGQTLRLVLPRPLRPQAAPAAWQRLPLDFGWMLIIVSLAVALGAYPIIRRLTLRLESLQTGVERWGGGDLSTRLNAQGNDEVAFLAARFNHAAERIETLMNSHRSLLANASHELRSPLARIRMSLELMNVAPTLVASRTALDVLAAEPLAGRAVPMCAGTSGAAALPPEGAELAWGGPALRSPVLSLHHQTQKMKFHAASAS